VLSAEHSPLGVQLPLSPEVEVGYGFELERWQASGDRAKAEIGVRMGFSGRQTSEELDVELLVTGSGDGRVEVALAAGKLSTSTRQATIDLVPRPTSDEAVSLPSLRLVRWCEAGVRS
jgi:hypothetical protein